MTDGVTTATAWVTLTVTPKVEEEDGSSASIIVTSTLPIATTTDEPYLQLDQGAVTDLGTGDTTSVDWNGTAPTLGDATLTNDDWVAAFAEGQRVEEQSLAEQTGLVVSLAQ